MAKSHKVFLDSSILEAFIDRVNTNHVRSVNLLGRLAKERYTVFTSQMVVESIYQLLERKISKVIAHEFLQAIVESNIEVLFPTKADLTAFYKLTLDSKDRQVGLQEGVNAVLMKKNGINYIATFSFWNNFFGTMQF